MNQGKTEDRLEDEAPPPLVPSEIGHTEKRLQREGTFNRKDDDKGEIVPTDVEKQLEDTLRDLTEEKQMLLAQNQWLQEESASRLKIIETESQRNKQLEITLQQMTEKMDRMRSEIAGTESIAELHRNRDELRRQVENLITENASLRKENETFRKQQSEDILCLEEDFEPNQPNPTIEHLERNLKKYRAARRKLKGVIEKLISENHRLRESIENHRNEGSFAENDAVGMKVNPLDGDVSEDEEIINRTNYFEERRKQKRSQQKCIDVRKYAL
ncbi:uncharacterized protein LOC135717454 [Ochlerotatus camptorhynchus]|uniref:uncharacterized protein LOC135717454 n=1 Tax=Ochlerotatus camptorhynchus TaxID=644619 RepID=UPI0031E09212